MDARGRLFASVSSSSGAGVGVDGPVVGGFAQVCLPGFGQAAGGAPGVQAHDVASDEGDGQQEGGGDHAGDGQEAAVEVEGLVADLGEHIGSTAVLGLIAKPIIDLAVQIQNETNFEQHQAALAKAGWLDASGVKSHRVLVREERGSRGHIVHFFEVQEWDLVDHRILRDWLLAHPADRDRYAATKLAATEQARDDGGYNAGKTAIIQELIDAARAARGLPSVPVYDK